jgi:DnaJ-class molecular chaperone
MISAYEVLGVYPESSEEQIRSHFRKRLPLFHPDLRRDRDTRDYLDYRRAYDILKDSEKRLKMGELPLFGDHLRFRSGEIQPELRQLFENLTQVQNRLDKTGS